MSRHQGSTLMKVLTTFARQTPRLTACKDVSTINIYSNKLIQKKNTSQTRRENHFLQKTNSNLHKMKINHKLWFCFFLWIFPAAFAQQYRNNCFSRNAQSFVCHTTREENSAPGGWREDSLNLCHGSNFLTRDDTLACLPQCLAQMHWERCSLLLVVVEVSQLCHQAYYSLHYPQPNTSWMFYKLMEKVCAVKWKFVKSLMGNFGNQIGIDSSCVCSVVCSLL